MARRVGELTREERAIPSRAGFWSAALGGALALVAAGGSATAVAVLDRHSSWWFAVANAVAFALTTVALAGVALLRRLEFRRTCFALARHAERARRVNGPDDDFRMRGVFYVHRDLAIASGDADIVALLDDVIAGRPLEFGDTR